MRNAEALCPVLCCSESIPDRLHKHVASSRGKSRRFVPRKQENSVFLFRTDPFRFQPVLEFFVKENVFSSDDEVQSRGRGALAQLCVYVCVCVCVSVCARIN
jgi:hypothetical protein